jgi:hypothetical protein
MNYEYSLKTVDGVLLCNISSQFYVTFTMIVWCAWRTFLLLGLFQLTKETTVQATGVASNLVEAIQGAGFKLQTLSLSFDDFDDITAAGGNVQPSEWANLCCRAECQMHIILSGTFTFCLPRCSLPLISRACPCNFLQMVKKSMILF